MAAQSSPKEAGKHVWLSVVNTEQMVCKPQKSWSLFLQNDKLPL